MQIDQKIIEEANILLSQGSVTLPHQFLSSPSFWLAKEDDSQVIAFFPFEHGDQSYKIGVMK